MEVESIEKTVGIIQSLTDNWEYLTALCLAILAGLDKVALVVITTLRNILDTWELNFPKKRSYNRKPKEKPKK